VLAHINGQLSQALLAYLISGGMKLDWQQGRRHKFDVFGLLEREGEEKTSTLHLTLTQCHEGLVQERVVRHI
jgi:hypothetical protein